MGRKLGGAEVWKGREGGTGSGGGGEVEEGSRK